MLQRIPRTPTGRLGLRHFFSSIATIEKQNVPSIGDKLVVEQDDEGNALKEPILVVPVAGHFYAIDATCPHMSKSMERGKVIDDDPSNPQFQCPLHNSRFSLKTGQCTQWVTGALGYDNTVVSSLAQKVGGERRDVKAYRVVENDDGSLTIEDGNVSSE